jgi:hypothetical protein
LFSAVLDSLVSYFLTLPPHPPHFTSKKVGEQFQKYLDIPYVITTTEMVSTSDLSLFNLQLPTSQLSNSHFYPSTFQKNGTYLQLSTFALPPTFYFQPSTSTCNFHTPTSILPSFHVRTSTSNLHTSTSHFHTFATSHLSTFNLQNFPKRTPSKLSRFYFQHSTSNLPPLHFPPPTFKLPTFEFQRWQTIRPFGSPGNFTPACCSTGARCRTRLTRFFVLKYPY